MAGDAVATSFGNGVFGVGFGRESMLSRNALLCVESNREVSSQTANAVGSGFSAMSYKSCETMHGALWSTRY